MAGFAGGEIEDAGRHDGHRSRRRRAERNGDGDRTCRAFRSRATAPIARPDRPRRRSLQHAFCSTKDRSAKPRKARLSILRETEDGFRIAEEDLRLRGAGELLGTRQSGLPELRLADLMEHQELIQTARDDARLLLDKDPDLTSQRGEAVKICSISSNATRLHGRCAPADSDTRNAQPTDLFRECSMLSKYICFSSAAG